MRFISKYVAYLRDNPEQYWFKRKLFGWGWTPVRWQGWAVVILAIGLIVLNAMRLGEVNAFSGPFTKAFLMETASILGILLFICYVKGERPRWQWGFPKEEDDTVVDRE